MAFRVAVKNGKVAFTARGVKATGRPVVVSGWAIEIGGGRRRAGEQAPGRPGRPE